jgi:predicted XRE-type DNA-binding protein
MKGGQKSMNEDIKAYAKVKKVKLWQVAEALDVTDSQLSRKMRHELEPELKHRIMKLVDKIADEKQSA